MATDKVIGLDLTKRDGFNKAITGRVGDKGQSYLFKLFNNGLLFDLEDAQSIALLGLTPSGYYVDAVGFPQEDGTVKVELPSAFNAEMGYFQRCFIRVTTHDGEIFSTQDLIYYSYGDADISTGGGSDYIGRVEDLINQLNKVAQDFEDGLNSKYDELVQEMQQTTDALEDLQQKMADLISQGAITKPQADASYMGKVATDVVAEDWNTLTTVGTYTVGNATGANRPDDFTFGTLLVQGNGISKTQTAISATKMFFRRQSNTTTWGNWVELGTTRNMYTKTEIDTKLANVATSGEVNTGTNNTKPITPKALKDSTYTNAVDVVDLMKANLPFTETFGEGTPLSPVTTGGTIVPLGSSVGGGLGYVEKRPYTINGNGTLTFTRNCKFLMNTGLYLIVGDTNPTDYLYVSVYKNGNLISDLVMQGAATGVTLRLTWSATGQAIVDFSTGDVLSLRVQLRGGKQAYHVRHMATTITEL